MTITIDLLATFYMLSQGYTGLHGNYRGEKNLTLVPQEIHNLWSGSDKWVHIL